MGIEQYKGRVALVTGASYGIGATITQTLQRAGLIVVGFDKDLPAIQALDVSGASGDLYALEGDVSKEEDILHVFHWVKNKLGGVDVLVNAVGAITNEDLTLANTSEWRDVLDVNVLGLSICVREAVKDMTERNTDGYIISINSVAAHTSPILSSKAMYYASKHAVKALGESLRKELVLSNSKIRNATISPGAVKMDRTEEDKSYNEYSLQLMPFLETEDIADIVIFILSQPQRVQIQDIIVSPTGTTIY